MIDFFKFIFNVFALLFNVFALFCIMIGFPPMLLFSFFHRLKTEGTQDYMMDFLGKAFWVGAGLILTTIILIIVAVYGSP